MPTFNAETACKALDQRVTALERAMEGLKKVASSDAGAAKQKATDDRVKAHDDRLAKMESVVKVLGETRTATKVDAMEKSLKALHDAKLLDEDTFRKQMAANDDKRGQEIAKETKVMIDKQIAEAQKQTDSLKLEARLILLETQIKTLMAKG
jgi:hypothetical protein